MADGGGDGGVARALALYGRKGGAVACVGAWVGVVGAVGGRGPGAGGLVPAVGRDACGQLARRGTAGLAEERLRRGAGQGVLGWDVGTPDA